MRTAANKILRNLATLLIRTHSPTRTTFTHIHCTTRTKLHTHQHVGSIATAVIIAVNTTIAKIHVVLTIDSNVSCVID